jgi:hypothetical protein
MLILKGKFLTVKRGAVACGVACALLAGGCPATVAAAQSAERAATPTARAPDSVAAEFYGWYLDVLSADQDPLSDRHERFSRYVARDLTGQLILRLQQPPLPELDYFLQARDYEPAWRRNVRTAVLRRVRDGAEVLVTLGGGDGPARVLVLTMVPENGAWKIRRVATADRGPADRGPADRGPAYRGPAESSLEQPAI